MQDAETVLDVLRERGRRGLRTCLESGRRACVTDVTDVVNVIDYVCMRTGVVSVGPDRCAVGTDRADGGAAPGRAPGDPSAPSDRGRDLVSEPDGLLVAPTAA